jgi:hypothetical protein
LSHTAPQAAADPKKKDLHASERDRPDNEEKRQAFFKQLQDVPRQKLYFFDETGLNLSMTGPRSKSTYVRRRSGRWRRWTKPSRQHYMRSPWTTLPDGLSMLAMS